MENQRMFCFQCQETVKGTGCTVKGVCGKEPQTSMLMDMLVAAVRGVGYMADALSAYMTEREKGCRGHGVEGKRCDLGNIGHYITEALFSTITNANFDDESLKRRIRRGLRLRDAMIERGKELGIDVPDCPELSFRFGDDGEGLCTEAWRRLGVLRTEDEDIRSLKELVMYGLKGLSAYYDHASRLGRTDHETILFVCHALAAITMPGAEKDRLLDLVRKTGEAGVKVMAMLDEANTATYGTPEITKVNIGVGKRPGILISGHDLHDLHDLLRQTAGTGIDIYTHGEMLPAHYYPKLKSYGHLVANYGNAWWQQREEFEHFNGPIVFTTNCIVPPRHGASYAGRVFTLNSAGYPGWKHIPTCPDGHKDFSEVIAMARNCAPPDELETGYVTGGFAHGQVLALADRIVAAVRNGRIRRFVIMSGCDGRMPSRRYYTDFARALPHDDVILTSGCAKYRYLKLNLGDIDGIPRVLDAGQCNDSYSWVVVAGKLKEIFKASDINDLPIAFNIAWYEQKAVIVLLALLSLGIKHIHIGPTLPAFLSPGVLKVLEDEYDILNEESIK